MEHSDETLVRIQYAGMIIEIVESQEPGDSIRFIDSSSLTDMEMIITVSHTVVDLMERQGSMAAFLLALQQTAIQVLDAKLANQT
jgi:hypothetical protein